MNRSNITTCSAVPAGTESVHLRNYYKESDFFVSVEGILKILSVVTGLAASALLVWGGACVGAPWLVRSGAAVALAGAALSASLYAGVLASLPAHAPNAYFYTDLVLSTVLGITMLVFAVLNMTFCDMAGVIDYFHGPVALINSGLVAGSAVATYASVMRRLDASLDTPAPTSAPLELDV